MTSRQLRVGDDPHGAAMLEYLEGAYDGSFSYVRDDGRATGFDIGGRFRTYSDFSTIDKQACAMVVGRSLDVGCGSGKHVLGLRELGLECQGVDNSPFAEAIWRRCGYDGLHIMDAFDLTFEPDSFDSITLFANGLSMGGTPEGVRRLLTEFDRVTPTSGAVVLTNIDVTASTDSQDRAYHQANIAAGRVPGQLTLRSRYRSVDGPTFPWLLMSPTELREIVGCTAWRVSDLWQQPNGPYAARLTKR